MRKLLILDLDETIIHGEPGAIGADFLASGIPIFIRPGARQFLEQMEQIFDLAVWTSASPDYASDIVRSLFPQPEKLKFFWCRERCVQHFDHETGETTYVKDLKKVRRLGRRLANVLVVDDSPEKLQRNYGNLVRVPAFLGGEDDILPSLAHYLKSLAGETDVRKLEKRRWLK